MMGVSHRLTLPSSVFLEQTAPSSPEVFHRLDYFNYVCQSSDPHTPAKANQ